MMQREREREGENWFSTHIRVPDVPAKSHQLAASICILNFAEDLKFMLMNSFSTSKETGCGPGCSRKVHDVGLDRDGHPKHPKATKFQDRHHQFWMILPPVSGNPPGTYDWIRLNIHITKWLLCLGREWIQDTLEALSKYPELGTGSDLERLDWREESVAVFGCVRDRMA